MAGEWGEEEEMSIGEPQILVYCDVCNDSEAFEMTPLVQRSWDARNLPKTMERQGWRKKGDQDVCPTCTENEDTGAEPE